MRLLYLMSMQTVSYILTISYNFSVQELPIYTTCIIFFSNGHFNPWRIALKCNIWYCLGHWDPMFKIFVFIQYTHNIKLFLFLTILSCVLWLRFIPIVIFTPLQYFILFYFITISFKNIISRYNLFNFVFLCVVSF